MGEGMPHGRGGTCLYDLLQVSPKATPGVIQAAYRALARDFHPDVNRKPGAAESMRQLNLAYEVLSDSARRARYDARLARSMRATGARPMVHSGQVPGIGHSVRRAPTPRIGRRATSPMGRAIVLGALVASFAVLCLLTWSLVHGLDEQPEPGVQTRIGTTWPTSGASSGPVLEGPVPGGDGRAGAALGPGFAKPR